MLRYLILVASYTQVNAKFALVYRLVSALEGLTLIVSVGIIRLERDVLTDFHALVGYDNGYVRACLHKLAGDSLTVTKDFGFVHDMLLSMEKHDTIVTSFRC